MTISTYQRARDAFMKAAPSIKLPQIEAPEAPAKPILINLALPAPPDLSKPEPVRPEIEAALHGQIFETALFTLACALDAPVAPTKKTLVKLVDFLNQLTIDPSGYTPETVRTATYAALGYKV